MCFSTFSEITGIPLKREVIGCEFSTRNVMQRNMGHTESEQWMQKPSCMRVYLVFSLDCILHKCSWLNLNHIRPLQWTPSNEPPEQSVDSIPYGLLTVDREKISPGEINPWNLAISVLEWVQVPAGESIICTYNFQLCFSRGQQTSNAEPTRRVVANSFWFLGESLLKRLRRKEYLYQCKTIAHAEIHTWCMCLHGWYRKFLFTLRSFYRHCLWCSCWSFFILLQNSILVCNFENNAWLLGRSTIVYRMGMWWLEDFSPFLFIYTTLMSFIWRLRRTNLQCCKCFFYVFVFIFMTRKDNA